MFALFSDDFVESLEKHATLRDTVQRKVDMILANPIGLGNL